MKLEIIIFLTFKFLFKITFINYIFFCFKTFYFIIFNLRHFYFNPFIKFVSKMIKLTLKYFFFIPLVLLEIYFNLNFFSLENVNLFLIT